jgi:hypothetical protein
VLTDQAAIASLRMRAAVEKFLADGATHQSTEIQRLKSWGIASFLTDMFIINANCQNFVCDEEPGSSNW